MHFHSSAQRVGVGEAVNEKWRRAHSFTHILWRHAAISRLWRVPAGRAFSWCKLSIRSEEQKYKEACVKDWIPTPGGQGRRSSQRSDEIDLPFPLYLQFPASFFPAIPAVAVEFACQFSSFHCFCLLGLHVGWIWEGITGNTVLPFPSGAVFLLFLLDWFVFVG